MSYCRWSPVSDVYVYPSIYGCTIHLAERKRKPGAAENPHEFLSPAYMEWEEQNDKQVWEDIEPYNGGTYWNLADEEECLEFLLKLKEAGYKVPEHALDRLREEING